MTLYRAQVLDTPDDPFRGGQLRADADAGLLVADGVIVARGSFTHLRRAHPDEAVVDLSSGVLLPGFVDTHVHYPQMRAIGALGMPLLEWLDRCALPEEARLADIGYAREIAKEFVASRRRRHDHGAGFRLAFRTGGGRSLRDGSRMWASDHWRAGGR